MCRDLCQVHFRTENRHQLRDLYANRIRADNVQTFRRADRFKHCALRQIRDVGQPWNVRRDPARAGRDQKMSGADMLAIDGDLVWRQKLRVPGVRVNIMRLVEFTITSSASALDR